MGTIADFTGNVLWSLRATPKRGCGREVDLQLADTGMRLDPHFARLQATGGAMLLLPA